MLVKRRWCTSHIFLMGWAGAAVLQNTASALKADYALLLLRGGSSDMRPSSLKIFGGFMPYKDPKKQLENYNRWKNERRLQWLEENGPCRWCGSSQDLRVDHIDPKQKEYEIGKIWGRRAEVLLPELAKCQVLCEGCHYVKSTRETKERNEG
jgi:hypothetical protein